MTAQDEKSEALDRILQLIASEYDSDASFEADLSLPPKTVSNWRLGRSHSYRRLIPTLCEHFRVSPADLFGVTPSGGTCDLSEDEGRILSLLRAARTLSPERRTALFATVESVVKLYLSDAPTPAPRRGRPPKTQKM